MIAILSDLLTISAYIIIFQKSSTRGKLSYLQFFSFQIDLEICHRNPVHNNANICLDLEFLKN